MLSTRVLCNCCRDWRRRLWLPKDGRARSSTTRAVYATGPERGDYRGEAPKRGDDRGEARGQGAPGLTRMVPGLDEDIVTAARARGIPEEALRHLGELFSKRPARLPERPGSRPLPKDGDLDESEEEGEEDTGERDGQSSSSIEKLVTSMAKVVKKLAADKPSSSSQNPIEKALGGLGAAAGRASSARRLPALYGGWLVGIGCDGSPLGPRPALPRRRAAVRSYTAEGAAPATRPGKIRSAAPTSSGASNSANSCGLTRCAGALAGRCSSHL